MEKRCANCHLLCPMYAFPKDKRNRDGYSYWCKACRAMSKRKFNECHPGYSEDESRKRRYKLSKDEFETKKAQQQELCAICNKSKKLHVDHDHAAGQVRGLICHDCNSLLGWSKENISTLHAAIEYLNTHAMQ